MWFMACRWPQSQERDRVRLTQLFTCLIYLCFYLSVYLSIYLSVYLYWCSERLADDEEFELVGDVTEALKTDSAANIETSTAAANGNNLRTSEGT